MAHFKQIPQVFLFRKMVGYWKNMVRNYRGVIQDNDFLDVVRNGFDHDKAVELIEAAYAPEELKALAERRSRRVRLDLDDTLDDVFQVLWNDEKGRGKCRAILETIGDCMLAENAPVKGEVLEHRFAEIKRTLRLSDLELEVLLVAYVRSQTCFCWPVRVDDRDKPLYFAMALDRPLAEVLTAMNAKGTLRRLNILDNDWDFSYHAVGGYLDGVDETPIERRFYKRSDGDGALPWAFFGDLAKKDGALLLDMLAAKPGRCNILLYGAPGTGKTSFARTLARESGRAALEIQQGEDERSKSADARLVGVQICNGQEDADASLMIIDEADELLRGNISFMDMLFGGSSGGKSTEKGVMNDLLDGMKMPAVWICNAPAQAMDESVRRRFDYSICFEELSHAQRVSIWRNIVEKLGLGELVTTDRLETYAERYATNAGGIATVLENVKRLAPEKERVDALVETLMKPHCKLLGVPSADRFLPAKGYCLEGLNIKGKVSLDGVVQAVRNFYDAAFSEASEDRPRMNLLLYGPPGTGKTEFLKYLGKALDRRVIVKRGSDLLSKWVGDSEKNIAAAFEQAERERAILFFDEVDGLVRDRAGARASWEVTQVNELLQRMEDFDGVMVAATNFCRDLDPAVMRRFTFKLEFDYLDDAGKELFFERFFKTPLTEDERAALRGIRNLAPGDFRTVRQEQFYLGGAATNARRLDALREECAHKKDDVGTRARIGF